jgi:hypothetical protein
VIVKAALFHTGVFDGHWGAWNRSCCRTSYPSPMTRV